MPSSDFPEPRTAQALQEEPADEQLREDGEQDRDRHEDEGKASPKLRDAPQMSPANPAPMQTANATARTLHQLRGGPGWDSRG